MALLTYSDNKVKLYNWLHNKNYCFQHSIKMFTSEQKKEKDL